MLGSLFMLRLACQRLFPCENLRSSSCSTCCFSAHVSALLSTLCTSLNTPHMRPVSDTPEHPAENPQQGGGEKGCGGRWGTEGEQQGRGSRQLHRGEGGLSCKSLAPKVTSARQVHARPRITDCAAQVVAVAEEEEGR